MKTGAKLKSLNWSRIWLSALTVVLFSALSLNSMAGVSANSVVSANNAVSAAHNPVMSVMLASVAEQATLYSFIGVILVLIVITIASRLSAKKAFEETGHAPPDDTPNFTVVFFIMCLAALVVIFGLKAGLAGGSAMFNTLLFAAFPYVAITIFIVGSIYRYMNRGFQVSSLSSQFLEGRKLFSASQPFHWGMLVLFLGHLTAFLFPRAIIAWNGTPVRLLILEISSFAFALSALFGLILFIRRRLTNDRVLIVTNRMDMLVYVVLLVQIISGLSVALFARWGSSWFASTLTPYIRSIFAFNPEIDAVNAMPWYIQVHIFSAFFILAVIPFTRFVHFLVAPIDYAWRRYQLVIWTWNPKAIRNSRYHFPGKRTKNN